MMPLFTKLIKAMAARQIFYVDDSSVQILDIYSFQKII
jgi:hypothetical protein